MALTQLKTSGIADDAVTTDKLANAINTERTANTAKVSLTDNSVTLAKMAGGTDGQIITYDASGDPVAVGPGTDGQVLTSTGAGSPPAFESISIPAGTTINNNADNRVITGSGTANTLEGESTLTYDAAKLNITSTTQGLGLNLTNTGNEYTEATFNAARTGTASALGIITGKWDGNQVAQIYIQSGEDTNNKDDGRISFLTQSESGASGTRLRIEPNGNVGINTTSPAHKLHVESAASGVISAKQTTNNGGFNIYEGDASDGTTKFYVTHNGRVGASEGIIFGSDTAATNVLDDYEEGTYDGTLSVTSGTLVMDTSKNQLSYTKIGRQCTITGRVQVSSVSGLSGYMTLNLPFAVGTSTEFDHGGAGSIFMYNAGGVGSPGYSGLWTVWTDGGLSQIYFTYGDSTTAVNGAKVSAGTEVRVTFTYFTS